MDRFQIIQHINRSFNQLRVNVMKTFRTGDKDDQRKYRLIKSHWKLLLKDSFALNSTDYHYNRRFRRPMSQKAIVDELLSFSEPLRIAYETCQRLYYHYQTKNSDAFFEEISTLDKRLPNWFFRKLTFFKRYENGIRNAFRYSYSNGLLKGINNKIKVIKRAAYGYRNFLNLRARIYLIPGLIFKEERLRVA